MHRYCRRSSATAFAASDIWSYEDVASLNIESVAANPSFIWIWCGNSQNVSRGRQLLTKWGYRRCEDLIWVKTNKQSKVRSCLSQLRLTPKAIA
jgi:N6-adenosine-specific RNA methylase IME4